MSTLLRIAKLRPFFRYLINLFLLIVYRICLPGYIHIHLITCNVCKYVQYFLFFSVLKKFFKTETNTDAVVKNSSCSLSITFPL